METNLYGCIAIPAASPAYPAPFAQPPYRLILNKAASDEIIWHCKHYTGRGVMKFYASGEDGKAVWSYPMDVFGT